MSQMLNSNSETCFYTKPNVGIETVLHNFMMKYDQRRENLGYTRVSAPYIESYRRNQTNNDAEQQQEGESQDTNLGPFISNLIVEGLKNARDKELTTSKVLVPCGLTDRIAADILLMSKDEPCGVRGCIMEFVMEDGNLCQRMGKVELDPYTVTTFEITLVLTKDTPRWLVSKLQSYLRNSYEAPTTVKQGYKLIKRKLYRSDDESRITIREVSL
ncbi:DNA damage-inducible transcript 4-like protein [Amphiura filiformis]|uniref:DNA damage-inducible transcript 4-like protein n=1 Tax=Amphiura filiformis TaxID=82378 RepID=UPI003B22044E